jgi:6-methylsalicylate decarboxylase
MWTEPLLDALSSRRTLPFVAREDGLTVLHSAGERPYAIDVDSEAPGRRVELLASDRLDRALIAMSSPIGIEALPRERADELIDAQLEGVGAVGVQFAAWGPVALREPVPDDVDKLLARGCIGISIPAGAMAGPDALESVGPLLERVAEREVALFVHPGPLHNHDRWEGSLNEPLWWRALTGYVAQMQAAWLTFVTIGRREHPRLVVLFAMLAGGAPLLSERLAARGGPRIVERDPRVFYDTSSYGPSAIAAIAQRVGDGQLVYGSDRPVIEPVPTGRDAILRLNAGRLVAGQRTPA